MLDSHKSIEDLLEEVKKESVADYKAVDKLISQWQTPLFMNRMRYLNSDRQHDDMNLMDIDAQHLREAILAKAAPLYLTLDEAVRAMDRIIARETFAHPPLRNSDNSRLPFDISYNQTIVLGSSSQEDCITLDFSELPHLLIIQDGRPSYLMRVMNEKIASIPNAKCLLLGTSFTSKCQLAVPPAYTLSEQIACIDWLRSEVDERLCFVDSDEKSFYPLFVFINTYNNHILSQFSLFQEFLNTCGGLNVHLIFAIDMPVNNRSLAYPEGFFTAFVSFFDNHPDSYGAILIDATRRKHLLTEDDCEAICASILKCRGDMDTIFNYLHLCIHIFSTRHSSTTFFTDIISIFRAKGALHETRPRIYVLSNR